MSWEEIMTKTKQLLLVLIVFAFLFGGNLTFAQKRYMMNENEAQDFKIAKGLYQKGEQLFKKGNYNKAEKTFNECLDKFPKYANADYFLGRIYYQQKDYLRALEHMEKAKENYQFIADLGVSTQLEYMEKLRQQKHQVEEDIRTLKQQMTGGSSSSRTNPRANTQAESQIASLEKTRDMINDRLRAPVPEKAEPPADFFYVHGNILFKLKKYKEAFDQYHEAVRINPGHGNAYVNLANMYFMAKKYQKALFYLEKAESCGAAVNPEFRKALYKAMRKK